MTGRPGLTIAKKQNGPATVKAGATVEYTITVTNTGATAYPAAGPASFTDDLSELLDDVRYNGDATATRGTTTYDEPVLTWSGALAPGENATITFSVTTNARTFGDLKLINTVVSDTPGNNCPARSVCHPRGTGQSGTGPVPARGRAQHTLNDLNVRFAEAPGARVVSGPKKPGLG
ncbi:CARDB domain-containing protein [Streptomyces clavuligerus]|uniref:DUF7927 domain-containing protein n=1 Tax=Streptomyces clavuligerus TaxID=1901 RepID=UPI0001851958|nr:CARDB domain-containing protein [Streptomyces clavuligerus]WDN56458.1 DUF11 domain-containing protein [Streptomyces clavuligerus]